MIDLDRGEIVLDGGGRVARGGRGHSTLPRQRCDGRTVDVQVYLDRALVELVDDPVVELATAWVERHLGPPRERFVRGAIWDAAWGYVYARQLSFMLVSRGHREPVPVATSTDRERVDFRCCECGAVTALPYGRGVLEAFSDRGAAMCPQCDAAYWVQAGSMTEYYRFSRRDDVCEVGKHPAADVQRYELVRTASPAELAAARAAGRVVLTGLSIKSCPAHVDVLRAGFLGCVLPS